MATFANPNSVLIPNRKFSKQELVMSVREMVADEYEATQKYMQVVAVTDDELAKKVITKIANEERVHAGEFLALLKELDSEEESYYAQGAKEVAEVMESLGKSTKKKKEREDTTEIKETSIYESPEQAAERIKKDKLKKLFA